MEIPYVVGGGPRRLAGSRWVVPQVRRGNACNGPVGSLETPNRPSGRLVQIPGVPGHIRSSELRSVN